MRIHFKMAATVVCFAALFTFASRDNPNRVWLFGDSVAVMCSGTYPRTTVGGYTSKELQAVVPFIPSEGIDTLVLMSGTNDIMQGHPAALVNRNLAVLSKLISERVPNAKIIIISPYAVDALPITMTLDGIHPNESGYEKLFQDAGIAYLLPTID